MRFETQLFLSVVFTIAIASWCKIPPPPPRPVHSHRHTVLSKEEPLKIEHWKSDPATVRFYLLHAGVLIGIFALCGLGELYIAYRWHRRDQRGEGSGSYGTLLPQRDIP